MKPRYWILGLVVLASTAYGLSIPDAKGFRDPSMARILLTHVPCAFLATILLTVSGWYGFRYLQKRQLEFDVKLAATVELGTIMALLTMATGLLFSQVQWGQPWQNDPRQISFLMVCLFYIGLIALRGGFSDPAKKASVTAAYALALLLPMLFLTFVFPRLPQVEELSFHPTRTIQQGQLDGPYRTALIASFLSTSWLSWEVIRFRILHGLKTLKENTHEIDDLNRPDSAPDGVVRPVRVRPHDQEVR
jgi:heme exporter protein C